jgi:hypothetical protein
LPQVNLLPHCSKALEISQEQYRAATNPPELNDMYCTLKLAIKLPLKRLSIKIKPNTAGVHIWLNSALKMFGDFICDHRKITHSWKE